MNIYDIAKEAGVSIATVSRVINGSRKVSERTRAKVLAIMKETDYTPNIFARGLSGDFTNTVGILVPDVSNMYMSRAVSFLENRLHVKGYNVVLSCSGYDADGKEQHIRMLLDERIDAMVLVGSTYAGSGTSSHNTDSIMAAAEKLPVFLINGDVDADNIYCTYSNDEAVSYELTKKMIDSGCRQLLFITDSESYSANQKKAGFTKALRDGGISIRDEFFLHLPNSIVDVKGYLSMHSFEFDGCFATEDAMAIGVLKYAASRRLKVPEDISIVGYNNTEFCVASTPELTSVDNRLRQMCEDTVDRLIAVLSGNKTVPRRTSVACTVIRRGTTMF
ncbi:MAG: LacI family DNA-binding transcriptional regulator [Lachnospiraceae bacterium]|nr:LacI family DNA-binding transcriptional regulator [Lachnospiraceae bacterium]